MQIGTPSTAAAPVGLLLRGWRQRRRLSQLDLALEAEISTKHLSFVETGRSVPSRDMVLHLAERLDVPLRERNALLLAAGYAPVFRERSLDDPALKAAREAVDLLLTAHEPNPALAIDRHWTLLAANAAVPPLLAGIGDASLLTPPVNVMRVSLHPGGLAPLIENFGQWRAHLLARLRQQVQASSDPTLAALLDEVSAYPAPVDAAATSAREPNSVVVPMRLRSAVGLLSFISTTTIFGTPVDITLSEIALETMLAADKATADALRSLLLNPAERAER